MKTLRTAAPRPSRALGSRWLPALAACLATLLALPLHAVTIPNIPLQSGTESPPPNVMFILDDSGSMTWIGMPASLADPDYRLGVSGERNLDDSRITDASYVHNTIYYNPAITYRPWMQANGTRYPDASYRAASRHPALLTDPEDLAASVQTFYVPKTAGTTSTHNADYYRYQIRNVGGTLRVVRSEWLEVTSGNRGQNNAGCNTSEKYFWRNCTFATPTGRSDAEEMANYANWYAYHRSRMKVAKAGASEAFSQLAGSMRVGLDTINRNIGGLPFEIPVGTDNGLFSGSNRSTWFQRLHDARASGGTPLHRALQRAGEYYSRSDAAGPYGPESGSAQVSCRQNFAILTTDGYWNSTSGYTPVGDADGTAGPTITGPNGQTYTYTPARPYMDNFATTPNTRPDTLADVAMHYWKRDLRPGSGGLENNVATSSADPAFWQHMVTFGVSIGLRGRLDPKSDLTSITNGSKRWGDPTDVEDADRIDDLWHASVNGRGNFVAAQDPSEFARGLADALLTVTTREGSASNVAVNSTAFINNNYVYQASYKPGRWAGELAAYVATNAGVATKPVWRASHQIRVTGRRVFTWDGRNGDTFPTSAQTSALARTTGLAPVSGSDNAAYLLGDTSKERRKGGTLRDRHGVFGDDGVFPPDGLLGDIVNSSPFYVKETETIFVGANDGMLHAFDATTGAERFAYVPGGIDLAALATLSDPQYSHRYFVDGPVTVSTRQQTPGRNYLVGALGRGGKGLFGLDVTNPAGFGRNDVLWELGGSNANMGMVLGEPLIVTLNNGAKAAVVGNGINSTNGRAVLFLINLTTGAVIRELDTGIGGDNGLMAPRGRDVNADGVVDYVYAGDLKGNLWKFDLSGATASEWKIALGGRPLFTTRSGQPITGGVAIARNPLDGRAWVFFGTGRFLSTSDLTDTTVQSLYGLIDDGSAPVAATDLVKRDIVLVSGGARAFEKHAALPSGKKGWYIDFDNPSPGERFTTRPILRGSVLVIASIIPPRAATCEPGGDGYINAVDAFSGSSTASSYFDVNRDNKVDKGDDLDSNGTVAGSIKLGIGMPTQPTMIDELLVVGGSDAKVGSVLTGRVTGAPRRIMWREIIRD
ncbi:pilus assembly protein [Vulcaniibacterium gelatinicum]|uniref:pilus assembly protein n=1 Tax=Vulcaniibacterium gelatinicum TaxID=2598725 RepID=UPI001FE2FC88|nr:PilC/PilY family type IV pilus protein [Vulcaniibacterium gelatinicum]